MNERPGIFETIGEVVITLALFALYMVVPLACAIILFVMIFGV